MESGVRKMKLESGNKVWIAKSGKPYRVKLIEYSASLRVWRFVFWSKGKKAKIWFSSAKTKEIHLCKSGALNQIWKEAIKNTKRATLLEARAFDALQKQNQKEDKSEK
jgi:hypothetical protein